MRMKKVILYAKIVIKKRVIKAKQQNQNREGRVLKHEKKLEKAGCFRT